MGKLGKLIHSNLYTHNFSFQISKRNINEELFALCREAAEMDIFCVKEMRALNKRTQNTQIKTSESLSYSYPYKESFLYGHLQAICNYGNIDINEAVTFPVIEHGCFLHPTIYRTQASIGSMSRYRQKAIHNSHPKIPVFLFGPYIHYADPFYNQQQYAALKEQYGKTLLIIPEHNSQGMKVEFDIEKYITDILKDIAPEFDTIMALQYWRDVDNKIYDIFEAYGVKNVSAGYRWDPNFIRRLKTILSLSDMVIGNSIGTHVGYAVYMGKPFKYLEANLKRISSEGAIPYFSEKFATSDIIINGLGDDEMDKQKAACEPYWGFNEVKTPEEIKEIHLICKAIAKKCHGFYSRYNNAAQLLLKSNITDNQKKLLMDAMGFGK